MAKYLGQNHIWLSCAPLSSWIFHKNLTLAITLPFLRNLFIYEIFRSLLLMTTGFGFFLLTKYLTANPSIYLHRFTVLIFTINNVMSYVFVISKKTVFSGHIFTKQQ
jgi:hypothetical protein